jgi:hypothetical protein
MKVRPLQSGERISLSYRQKELVARVNELLAEPKITDTTCLRTKPGVDGQPTYFYKPQFSSHNTVRPRKWMAKA